MVSDRPSRTAISVAQFLVSLSECPSTARLLAPGVGRATLRMLEASDNLAPVGLRIFRPPKNYRSVFNYALKAIPGQMFTIAVRKRFMEDETRTAIMGGARQVLAVGAGLDTLCLRLAKEYPGVQFVETDHPATSLPKQRAVQKMGDLSPNLHMVAVDLAQVSLADTLDRHLAWDAGLQSVTMAEGVLPYLNADDVDRFFATIHARSGPGSRLLVTHMRLDGKGKVWLGELGPVQKAFLRLSGEKTRSGIPGGNARLFLEERGYRLDESALDLRKRFLVPNGWGDAPLGEAELLLAADRVRRRKGEGD